MIIATCGHQLKEKEGLGINIAVKDSIDNCRGIISYITVCEKCLKWYKKKKLILETEKERKTWSTKPD
jgi:hypothetical protein